MTLTDTQRNQLADAIDSHIYWQLSDHRYRANGAVLEPGSDDSEVAAEIAAFEALLDELTGTDPSDA